MLHGCIERCFSWDEKSVLSTYKKMRSKNPFMLEDEDWEDILNRLLMLAKDERFLTLIHSGQVFHEQPLRYNGERKQIDTLIVCKDKMIIIDYKSGIQKEEHRAQVQLYQEAIEAITGKSTQGWLFYLHSDRIRVINL